MNSILDILMIYSKIQEKNQSFDDISASSSEEKPIEIGKFSINKKNNQNMIFSNKYPSMETELFTFQALRFLLAHWKVLQSTATL